MIECKDISKKYDKIIFDHFNLTIPEHSITCILGESGVGKTTFLKMIAGMIPYQGTITGVEKISYIFQEVRLIPHLTVYENLKLICPKLTDEEILGVLKEFKIEDKINHYPKQLSGGEAKRVSIARAFLYDGSIILMDEPFASLDLSLKLDLISYFSKHWLEKKKTVIFVTHDIDEALLLGHSILLLKDGKMSLEMEIKNDFPRKLTEFTEQRNQLIKILLNQ